MLIRSFDIFLSGTALIVLSPLFMLVILILKFSGEGEIFFLQERIGINRKVFNLYKFATMLKESPTIGTGTVTMKNDPRILPVGSFLRKTKINELPQLFNVFIGDMSLIGPRPQTERCFDAFPTESQDIIIRIKPGLSGIGPIVFRGEEDILDGYDASLAFYDTVIGPYKADVEAWYVEKKSLRVYFLLILLTAWAVAFPKSGAIWKVFQDLPIPPTNLMEGLNYPTIR